MKKYGFIYIWFDRKHKRYYIGCHWGREDDGYICSSAWMKQAYRIRPNDFKRRILRTKILHRPNMYLEEARWLAMINIDEIKPHNPNPKYYNLHTTTAPLWHAYDDNVKTIGQKISKSKKGKSNGPCSDEVKSNISKAKKGKPLSDEHKKALTGIKKSPRSSELKKQASDRTKSLWENEEWRANQSEKIKQSWVKRKNIINNP